MSIGAENGRTKLTKRQLSVMRDFARGWDVATVARNRQRGVSSVYEIAGRICDRLGLDDWTDIGPYARKHGLVRPADTDPSRDTFGPG